MHMLKHLGFSDQPDAQIAHCLRAYATTSYTKPSLHTIITCCTLPCGIQLWVQWDPDGLVVVDRAAVYLSPNSQYLRPDTIWCHEEEGLPLRGALTGGVRARVKDRTDRLRASVSMPHLFLLDKPSPGGTEPIVAQLTAFPLALACYPTVADHLRAREAGGAPAADLKDPGGGEPWDTTQLTGIVVRAEEERNDATGLPFWHITVRSRGLWLDVVAAPDALPRMPRAGEVLVGEYCFFGCVLAYGDTGYHTHMLLQTPLTRGRFGPLVMLMNHLQAGETLDCELTQPVAGIRVVRAKGEAEGISLEYAVQDEQGSWRDLRYYPITRSQALRLLYMTLVLEAPPPLEEARDVTAEYPQEDKAVSAEG